MLHMAKPRSQPTRHNKQLLESVFDDSIETWTNLRELEHPPPQIPDPQEGLDDQFRDSLGQPAE